MKKISESPPVRVVRSMVRLYFKDGVARSSAELAYYLLFSIFPLLIFLNSIISRLNLNVDELFYSLNIVLPEDVINIFTDYLGYVSGLKSEFLLYSGLFLTLFMVSRAMRSLMRSVTRAYQMEQRKGAVYVGLSFALSLVLLVSIFLMLLVMVLSGTLLDKLGQYVRLSPQFVSLINWLSYIIAPVYLFFILSVFYDVVGGRQYSFKMAMPGAAFFVVIWLIATSGFSYYVANMANYSLLYGSIGAIMILMLWLYITGMLLILGGTFNYVIAMEFPRKQKN